VVRLATADQHVPPHVSTKTSRAIDQPVDLLVREPVSGPVDGEVVDTQEGKCGKRHPSIVGYLASTVTFVGDVVAPTGE
jgi:hypothetical protein